MNPQPATDQFEIALRELARAIEDLPRSTEFSPTHRVRALGFIGNLRDAWEHRQPLTASLEGLQGLCATLPEPRRSEVLATLHVLEALERDPLHG
jgi:hypothetical protein